MKTIQIRPGTADDLPFLQEMLFEAAYWHPGQVRPSLEDGLERPDLVYILSDWGRRGDTALIAILNDQLVGAAWYRFWGPEQHSYGYVSPTMPELSIAIKDEYRRQGVGSQLLTAILKTAKSQGLEGLSLSVEMDNPAVNLYRQHGFRPVQEGENAWTMVAKL